MNKGVTSDMLVCNRHRGEYRVAKPDVCEKHAVVAILNLMEGSYITI